VAFNRANFAEFVLSLVNQSTDFPRQSKTLRAHYTKQFQHVQKEREREREREREKGRRTEVNLSILRKLRGKTARPRRKKKKEEEKKNTAFLTMHRSKTSYFSLASL
jgi:hypothetical protein